MSLVHLLRCFVLRSRPNQSEAPLSLSSDEEAARARVAHSPIKVESNQLAATMAQENARRAQLFEEALREQERPTRRSTPSGAHIGYEMARASTRRIFCCGACGAWIGRPHDVVSKSQRAIDVSLDDSEETLCLNASNVREMDQAIEVSAGDAWVCRARWLQCAQCQVILGVRIESAERVPRIEERQNTDIIQVHLRSAPGMYVHAPSENSFLKPIAPVGTVLRIDLAYLGWRYLRLLDAHSAVPVQAVVPLLCQGCGRILTFTDQLLCVKRRWGFNATPPERACYVNSLCEANIKLREEVFEEHLAQGRMDMDDVFCACGKQVGYRFCRDKTSNLRNQHACGRYGLVQSCLVKASYEIFDNVYATGTYRCCQ